VRASLVSTSPCRARYLIWIIKEEFVAATEDAKKNCPVSQALTGTPITLSAEIAYSYVQRVEIGRVAT
jgi:hypothetical protein